MDYTLAMKAFLVWGLVFIGTLGGGVTYIFCQTSDGHVKRAIKWLAITNAVLIIEASLYNLFVLVCGGLQGREFLATLWQGLSFVVLAGVICSALALLAGFVTRYFKMPKNHP